MDSPGTSGALNVGAVTGGAVGTADRVWCIVVGFHRDEATILFDADNRSVAWEARVEWLIGMLNSPGVKRTGFKALYAVWMTRGLDSAALRRTVNAQPEALLRHPLTVEVVLPGGGYLYGRAPTTASWV